MARTAKAVTAVATAPGVAVDAAAAFSALDAANGHAITDAGQFRSILIHVKNTTASPKNITLKGGPNDLVFQVPATTGERLIHLSEDAFFEQAGEDFWLDPESGMTGSFAVYGLLR